MSFIFVCDWCGEEIGDDQKIISLDVKGGGSSVDGWVGHYHGGTGPTCWREMHERIMLVHEIASGITGIPVASAQQIAARRRRHHREDGSS